MIYLPLIWPLVTVILWGLLAWHSDEDWPPFLFVLALVWPLMLAVLACMAPFMLLSEAGKRHRRKTAKPSPNTETTGHE